MAGLIGALIERGWQANQDRAMLESLASYGQPGASVQDPNAGGMAPGGAAMSGTDQAAPAAATPRSGGGGFDPSQAGGGAGDSDQPSQAAQRGTQAEAIRKVIQAYAPDAKDMHTALKGMSVDQLEGILKGYSVQSAMQEHAARMQDYQAQAALRRQNAIDDQAAGTFVNNFMRAPEQPVLDPETGEPTDDTRAPSLQERWQHAAANTPNFGGRVVPKIVDALTKYGAMEDVGQAGQPVFREGPFPGTKIAQVPGSKKWQMVSDPNATQLQQATDEDGNPVPGVFRLGNRPIVTPSAKPRAVPESFHRAMDQVSSDVATAQATLGDETAPADKRARAARMLKTAQAQGKAIADRYHAAGDIPDELHTQSYQELGLGPPTTSSGSANAGGGATVGAGGRVMVQKAGKRFWLPQQQLGEALRQGYTKVQVQ